MPSVEIARNLDVVRDALDRKGFQGLGLTHYDNTPPGYLVLHDDHGRLARGEAPRIGRIIDEADDIETLWSALERAEMTGQAPARRD